MSELQAEKAIENINLQIEAALNQYKVELGQHNKNCVLTEIKQLWAKKRVLQKFIYDNYRGV